MALAKVFKNHVPNCKVFHPNGRQITFVGGKHITTLDIDIKYLESLVAEGDQYVYIDPNETEIDTEDLTPEGKMERMKRQIIAEYEEQKLRASQHVSNSESGPLKVTSSSDLMKMTADSNGDAGGVKVSAPKK